MNIIELLTNGLIFGIIDNLVLVAGLSGDAPAWRLGSPSPSRARHPNDSALAWAQSLAAELATHRVTYSDASAIPR